MPGREPTVSAEKVMQAIALHPEPVVTARDIHEDLDLKPDGARERLKRLVDEGYLEMKRPGGSALVFWMTDKGRSVLADIECHS